ncbi:MAG: hypothetical protein MI920_36680 [Kiloniellales bacterium]|nr:hypothetical protein [Kiloniellales bacterium]
MAVLREKAPRGGAAQALGLASRRILAVLLIAPIAVVLLDFPIGRLSLMLGLAVYLLVLSRYPRAWLFVVPAALPILDLAPWSGRFFLDEYDLLLATTLVALLWQRTEATGEDRTGRWLAVLVWLTAASYLVSTLPSVVPLRPIDANSATSYLSPYNALRVAKGFFWAWLLWPFLRHHMTRDPKTCGELFVAGLMVGLAFVGLAILWERGVLRDLYRQENLYAIAASLLDLTSAYRVTGPFSAMHTGGTAIDGFLALAAPLTLYPIFFARSIVLRLAGIALFGLAGYCVAVTFSRGLYLGFAAGLFVVALALFLRFRSLLILHRGMLAAGGIVLLGLGLALIVLFRHGGLQALVLAGVAMTAALLLGFLTKANSLRLLGLVLLGVGLLFGLGIYDAITESRWSDSDSTTAGIVSLAAIVLATLPAAGFARRYLTDGNVKDVIVLALFATTLLATTVPAVQGFLIGLRFARADEDLAERRDHWILTRSMMGDSLEARLVGEGTGSFPRIYFRTMAGQAPIANYGLKREAGTRYLALGWGDFEMIQRIDLKPQRDYRLRFEARARHKAGRLRARICHKHILSPRELRGCQGQAFSVLSDEDWQSFEVAFNTGALGADGLFYWPVTLMLSNRTPDSVIEVRAFSLAGSAGWERLANGDFSAGLDRWFLVSDILHLAWHVKNLYLHIFFEQGALGLIAFGLIAGVALLRGCRLTLREQDLPVVLLASLVAFLLVGLFGSLIDNPRITTLLYLILFLALTAGPPKAEPEPRQSRRRKGRWRRLPQDLPLQPVPGPNVAEDSASAPPAARPGATAADHAKSRLRNQSSSIRKSQLRPS